MTSNLHNAVSYNIEGTNSQLFSPWYNTFTFWKFRISDRVVTQLSSTNDPRLPIYADTIEDGTYKGFVNGWVDEIFGVEINKDYKTAIVINCPGNFVNSYIESNGDVTSIVEVYLDKQTKMVTGAALIPMMTQSLGGSKYRALPIFATSTTKPLGIQTKSC